MENEKELLSRLRSHPYDESVLAVLGDMYEENGQEEKLRLLRTFQEGRGAAALDSFKKLEARIKDLVEKAPPDVKGKLSWNVRQSLTQSKKVVQDFGDPELMLGISEGTFKPRDKEDLRKDKKGRRSNVEILLDDVYGLVGCGIPTRTGARGPREQTRYVVVSPEGFLDVERRSCGLKPGELIVAPLVGGGEGSFEVLGDICPQDILRPIDVLYSALRNRNEKSPLPSMRKVFKT